MHGVCVEITVDYICKCKNCQTLQEQSLNIKKSYQKTNIRG
jgi:hypothetical protein